MAPFKLNKLKESISEEIMAPFKLNKLKESISEVFSIAN